MSHRPSSLFVVTLLFACCASPVPSSAPDGAVVELYAVKDILFAAEPSQRIASEDLVVVLRDATDRDRWRDGSTIECEDSGILRVVATPRMQALVTNVLKDLRSTQRAGG